MNSIFTRRSIRQFKNKEVEEEKIEKILRAAMQAPSAGNQQPWEFIVVRKKETLSKLSGVSPYSGMIKDANVAIVLLGNEQLLKYQENLDQDMSACTQNLLLQVVEEGLGAVWLGVTPLGDRMQYLVNLFNLERHLTPFAVVPIGYPEQENHFVDRFDKTRIHYEEY